MKLHRRSYNITKILQQVNKLKIANINKTYIIAEIGNNHNGSISKAKKLIDVAKECGANAVKFQSFTGKDIVASNILAKDYPEWDDGKFKYWYQFLDKIALPLNKHQEVIDYCVNKKIDFITTPVSPKIVNFLETLENINCYKIASMDLNNLDLLISLSSTGKNLILSTGMGTIKEVQQAYKVIKNSNVKILHCVSDYPLRPQDASLGNIKILKQYFPNLDIGFSDHSLGHDLSLIAIKLGAKIIEKHITLDRNDKNRAEHHFSLEPDEFKNLVYWIRTHEEFNYKNKFKWERSNTEKKNKVLFRRSLRYKHDLKKGSVLSENDLIFVRPGDGIGLEEKSFLLGKTILSDVKKNEPCLKKKLI